MRKYVLLSVAILALCAWMAADSIPSTKTAAQMGYIGAVQLAPAWGDPILEVDIKTGAPKDLIISVSAETSLTTSAKLSGTTGSEALAAIEIQVRVDGVPIVNAGGPNANFIVFNNRLLRLTGDLSHHGTGWPEGMVIDDHWIEVFIATKSANAFNWFEVDVGPGVSTVSVYARKVTDFTSGKSTAVAMIGNASVVVDEVNLKN